MRYSLIIASLIMASFNTVSFASDDSQSIGIYVPKISLFSVDPPIPFSFEKSAGVATGNSKLAISSNVPEARLQIIASGATISVTSDSIQCPPESGNIITCKVGIKLVSNGTLNFIATRTRKDIEPNITYIMLP